MNRKPGFKHGFWALVVVVLLLPVACGNLPITTPTEVPDGPPAITSTATSSTTSTAASTATSTPTSTPTGGGLEIPVVSPDGMYRAMIQDGSRLIVVGVDGIEREVAKSAEIIHFAWFPDSQHIVYVDRIPSHAAHIQYEYRVWIANVGYVFPYEIADGFAPLVSPDGRHIAFMLGAQAGDACVVAYGLGIIQLDDEFRPVSLIRQRDIQGIPLEEDYHSFIPDLERDLRFPGFWQDASTLNVAMRWACVDQYGQNGVYTIDLGSNTAVRNPE